MYQAQIISHPQKSQYIGKYLSQPIIDFSNQLRVLLVLVKMQTPENCFSCGGIGLVILLLLYITYQVTKIEQGETHWILLPSYCENYKFRQLCCYTMQAICNFFFSDKLRKFAISDFPMQMVMQTHFGHILITLFFFLTL